ncbi:MAG: hypothetical protein U1F43_26120 [Myxococcota bacterium]
MHRQGGRGGRPGRQGGRRRPLGGAAPGRAGGVARGAYIGGRVLGNTASGLVNLALMGPAGAWSLLRGDSSTLMAQGDRMAGLVLGGRERP